MVVDSLVCCCPPAIGKGFSRDNKSAKFLRGSPCPELQVMMHYFCGENEEARRMRRSTNGGISTSNVTHV